jgi:RNA polymerase sigma-70 factor (ECF subfamily)
MGVRQLTRVRLFLFNRALMTFMTVMKSREMDDQTLERCRAYLKLLACGQVDSWLGQQIDASDLVQQTLLDAVVRTDQFRGKSEAEFFAWLREILKNNLIDAFRHHGCAKRDVARNRSLDEDISKSFRRVDALATGSRSTPSQQAATNEQLLRLPPALEALSDAQREAIVLHYLHGLKLSETSKKIGRSEAAVCGLLHRGLKRLQELLEE